MGLIFTGVAFGPTLSSFLIRLTDNVLSVFYAATLMHILYGILVWFIIPESLTQEQMTACGIRHRDEIRKIKEARIGAAAGVFVRIKRIFSFLSPLALFVPKTVESQNPLKGTKRDWNLSLVAAAYGSTIMVMVRIFHHYKECNY